jgi:hypothetical protein
MQEARSFYVSNWRMALGDVKIELIYTKPEKAITCHR